MHRIHKIITSNDDQWRECSCTIKTLSFPPTSANVTLDVWISVPVTDTYVRWILTHTGHEGRDICCYRKLHRERCHHIPDFDFFSFSFFSTSPLDFFPFCTPKKFMFLNKLKILFWKKLLPILYNMDTFKTSKVMHWTITCSLLCMVKYI